MYEHVGVTTNGDYGLCALLLMAAWLTSSVQASDCDVTIISKAKGDKNGTFSSPGYPKAYGRNLHCTYKFIALPNERVKVKFTDFHVKGYPPSCLHDYVDVYTQVRTEDEDLLDLEMHGRYCGNDIHKNSNNLPHLLISMFHIFVIGFYTDGAKNATGFRGTYEFIDATAYNMGTPGPPKVCGYTVRSENKPRGFLMSPTYPGMYADNLHCYYKLIGRPGERIRLTFLDFDLFHGGDHCPFDSVEVFDGSTNEAPVIGTYCGKQEQIILYSTKEYIHIEFSTKSGRVPTTRSPYRHYDQLGKDFEIQRRGFKLRYEFNSSFVNLDFISKAIGTAKHEHVKGTECDMRVLSQGESNGTITSPNFPRSYPLNVTCKYYINGLINMQNLEKVKLKFRALDIPSDPGKNRCYYGYVALYLNKQSIKHHHATRLLCGDKAPAETLTSADPRLLLVFNSTGRYSSRGFQAYYEFVTDYAIPGTPATVEATCHFIYRSASMKQGTFNSPRHPSSYPINTLCQYDFVGQPEERVRITFESFHIEQEEGYDNCTKDFVEVYSIPPHPRPGHNGTLIGRYCGKKFPGPIISDYESSSMKIMFHSDGSGMCGGFKAKYEFIPRKRQDCSHNITSGYGGQILSPQSPHKYPRNVTCEWYIYARHPKNKIMLQFPHFTMEGASSSGCKLAVLKIFNSNNNIPDVEMCGREIDSNPIVSHSNHLRLQFISSASAVGDQGFKISWTELLGGDQRTGSFCGGFLCKKSQFCISSELKCDGHPNCGRDDNSDETSSCPSKTDHSVLHIILGVVLSMVLLILILVCILHRRRRVRKKKHKQQIEVRYVTRGHTNKPGEKLLPQERTEKVSIV